MFLRWLFGSKTYETKKEEKPKRKLFGYDLDKWEYLGRTRITFSDKKNEEVRSTDVFFFCGKEDNTLRSYHIIDKEYFKYHSWIPSMADVWKAGFRDLYIPIRTEPSPWLENYMKKKYNAKWIEKNGTYWWFADEDAKYQNALEKQKENVLNTTPQKKENIEEKESNVIQFPKKTT